MNAENARVRTMAADARRGVAFIEPRRAVPSHWRGTTGTDNARAFVMAYMWTHSQKSPTHNVIYVETPPDAVSFYASYIADMVQGYCKTKAVCKEVFRKVWAAVLKEGVTSPDGDYYEARIRLRRARGFGECNTCSKVGLCRGY